MGTAAEIIEHPAPALAPTNAVTPMEMLASAIERGMSPDVLEKLMTLNERWQSTQTRKAFDAAISAAKAEIPVIARNRAGHNDKKYVDFSAIARVVDPILGKHGLAYRFRTKQDERIHVTCILSHRDGHYEENTLVGNPDKTGSKNDIQAIGSTLTYLQRYSLVQALGLAAADDDDGGAAGAGERVSQEQADSLRDLLESKGASRTEFLKWAKVEKIEDIPAAYYDSCVTAINQYQPKKAAK